jgi:hypothetical protein
MNFTYNKYRNTKFTAVDGTVFDSRKEANRWDELLLIERSGEIKDLQRQVEFELIPSQTETFERYAKVGRRLKDGVRVLERACVYVADFTYVNVKTGERVVEDTKGVPTKDYIIKRKLMLWRLGIRIHEV